MIEIASRQENLAVGRSKMVKERKQHKKWMKKEDVLLEIKKIYNQGVRVNCGYMFKNHFALVIAARHYFKNWANAVKQAGLDYSKIRVIRRNAKVDFYLRQDFENYLRYERQLSERTTQNYLFLVSRFQKFLSQNPTKKELNNVTRQDISDFLRHLQEKNTVSSVSLYVIALRCYYKWAHYFYKIESLGQIDSFLNNIVRTKRIRSVVVVPKKEEIVQLRTCLSQQLQFNSWNKNGRQYRDTLRAYAIIELLITTGLRSRELMELRQQDIDLENKRIFIKDGKGGHQRVILFGDSAVDVLREYCQINKFLPDETIFRMSQDNVAYRTVKLWAAKAGINLKIHPHSFRHYFITETQRQGVPVTSVATQVGHRSLNTTLGYTHWDIDSLEEQFKECKI
jgi:site-specific recombinase XerD